MSGNTSPFLVSVVVPAWNAAGYLPATLETIFAQTLGPERVQVVVVDDGSTDATGQVIRECGGRVTAVFLENSGGPSLPRNQGIAHSIGEFVAFFDSDDLMDPEKLERAVETMVRFPDVEMVFSNFRSIDPTGQVLKEDYLAEYVEFRKDLKPTPVECTWLLDGQSAFRSLLRANFVGTSSAVCRRTLFDSVGPFDEEMKNADDIDMWLRIAGRGHAFAFLDRPLHSYRITPDGISARGPDRIPAVIKGLENQLPLCRREEDREFIAGQVRRLHLSRAWGLRERGDYREAIGSYKAGLAMGWDTRGMVGLVKTLSMALRQRN